MSCCPQRRATRWFRVPIVVAAEVRMLRVTLLRDGKEHDTRELALP